ncbi:hypothetical protein QP572_12180, partial [Brevibacterium sp. UMB10442]|nr:hypothetical protein [Brevibacterium sp. UMB10442]
LQGKRQCILSAAVCTFLPYFFSFTVRWVQRYGAVSPIQSLFAQVAACDTLGVDKRYHISVLILSFVISV